MGQPGVYKLGGWYATTDYADQRFGVNAAGGIVSLADPTVVGPLNHKGNGGIYAVADQMVWRAGERSLNLFAHGGVGAVRSQHAFLLLRWRRRLSKGCCQPRPNDALTFGVCLRQDQQRVDRARPGQAVLRRAALSDP